MKRKVFSAIICATLLFSTMAVLAGSTSAQFGVGTSSGTARLSCLDGDADAYTEPTYASVSYVRTYLKGNGGGAGYIYATGEYSAHIDNGPFLAGAESTHTIDGATEHLSVYND